MFHMAALAERAASAYADTVDSTGSVQVFGTSSRAILEMLRHQVGAGVSLTLKPNPLGGFVG
jgi:hypothetical protein